MSENLNKTPIFKGKRWKEIINIFRRQTYKRYSIYYIVIGQGVVEYHFYSDEISNIRRGEAELDIILARLKKSDIRSVSSSITDLSDPNYSSLHIFRVFYQIMVK